jgi:hypothetical protein
MIPPAEEAVGDRADSGPFPLLMSWESLPAIALNMTFDWLLFDFLSL